MTEVAGYELGRLLGQGNFGQTYEAIKEGQRVALKLIREEAVQQGFDSQRFERVESQEVWKKAGSFDRDGHRVVPTRSELEQPSRRTNHDGRWVEDRT